MSLLEDRNKAEIKRDEAIRNIEEFETLVEKFPHLSAAFKEIVEIERKRLVGEVESTCSLFIELCKRRTYYDEVKKILSEYDVDIDKWYDPKRGNISAKLKEEATDPKQCLVYAFEVLLENRIKYHTLDFAFTLSYPHKSNIEKAIEMVKFRAMLEGKKYNDQMVSNNNNYDPCTDTTRSKT